MTHTHPAAFTEAAIRPLTNAQLWQLMQGLKDDRVKVLKGMSYVEAWDVKATLTRVFGFGGFSTEITTQQLVHKEQVPQVKDPNKFNWAIAYSVTLRLYIHQLGSYYDESAVGSSSQPLLGEALDMAIKSASSDALKRCATLLGTQFGLSLYDDGNQNEVIKTIVAPGQEWHRGARVDKSAAQTAATMGAIVDGQRPASAAASVDHLRPEDASEEQHQQNMEHLNNALSAQVAKRQERSADQGTDYNAVAQQEHGTPAVLAGDRDE